MSKLSEGLVKMLRAEGLNSAQIDGLLAEAKSKNSCAGCSNGGMEQRLMQLENSISQMREPSGGLYGFGSRDQYVTAERQDVQPGEGGQIPFGAMTVPAGASAGVIDSVNPADANAKAQLDGQTVCSLFAIPSPELDDDLGDIRVTMKINGDTVPSVRGIVLISISTTADGEIQRYHPPGVRIRPNSNVELEAEAINGLDSSSEGTIQFFVEAGGRCGY